MAEARYNLLEQQMRPHFLFNSLNSLAELIESGHERATEMTHSIAEIYRAILANSKQKTVTLDAELYVVRRYLDLEKTRFGSRLKYVIEIDPSVGAVYVPSLVIQTLVENAVKHGIAGLIEGGVISLRISRPDGTRYLAEVTNTAPRGAAINGSGTGLANTMSRLDLLYGNQHGFQIVAEKGSVTSRFYFSGARCD